MAVVNELVTKFGFAGSVAPLAKFNTMTSVSIASSVYLSKEVIKLSSKIAGLVSNITRAIDPTIQLSRTTEVAIGRIQELGYVASVSGSSLGAVESTIASLSDKIGQAAWKGNEDFARLGISIRGANGQLKTADQILLDVGQRFKDLNLSKQEQLSFAGALGIDRSLIQMLNRTGEEFDSLIGRARDLGTLTKEQANSAASLNDSMTTLRYGFASVKNQIAVGLAPYMQEFSDGIVDLIANNKGLIKDIIGGIVDWTIAFAKAAKDLAPIAGIFAAITLPISGTAIAVVAAGLAIQDLIVAFKGGDSVIRDFVKAISGIDITPAMHQVWEWIKGFKDILVDIKNIIADLSAALGALSGGDFGTFIGKAGDAIGSWRDYTPTGLASNLGRSLFSGGSNSNTTNNNQQVSQQNYITVRTNEAGSSIVGWIKDQFSDLSEQTGMRGGR